MAVDVGDNIETLGIRTELVDSELAAQQLQQLGATGEASAQRVAAAYKTAGSQVAQAAVESSARTKTALEQTVVAERTATGGAEGLRAAQARWLAELPPLTAAQQRLAATTQLTANEVKAAAAKYDAMIAAQQASIYSTHAMAKAQAEAIAMNEKLGQSQGVHGLQLSRLNQEIGTFIGRLTGTNTAITRLTAQVGGAVAGYGQMIAVLTVIAGLGYVYDKLTEGARKAKEENEKLLATLDEIARRRSQNAITETSGAIAAGDKRLAELRAQLAIAEQQLRTPVQAYGGGGLAPGTDQASALKDVQRITEQIRQAEAERTEIIAKAAAERSALMTNELATLVKSDRATATQRANTIALLRGYQNELTALQRTRPEDTTAQADLVAKIQQLEAALKPAAASTHAVTVESNALIDSLVKQGDALRRVVAENNAETLKAKEAAEAIGLHGAALDLLNAKHKAEEDRLAAFGTLSGIVLTERLKAIDAIERENRATAEAKRVLEELTAARKAAADAQKEVTAIGAKNTKTGREQIEDEAARIRAEQDAADRVRQIWHDGFAKIITDGTKSWHDFFEDVLQLFSKLMREMEAKAKAAKLEPGGFAYNAFGVASSAIAGGLAGYQLGQNFGTTGGVLGGAAAGAIIGNTILPGLGAAVGGLAGAAGGLLGAADAQRKAAEEFRAAIKAFEQSAERFVMASGGNATGTQLLDLRQQFEALKSFADLQTVFFGFAGKLFGSEAAKGKSTEFAKTSADIDAAYKKYIERLTTTFTDSLTEGLNALNGPAGEYANHLAAIKKQYDDNIATAQALIADAKERKASEAELAALNANLAKVEELRAAQEAALAEALARATQQATEDLQVRRLLAEGHTAEADALRFQLDQQRELENLAKSLDLTDPAQAAELALLKVVLGLEATQHAADAAAAAMQAAASDIARDVQLGFTTPQAAIEQERQALGFGGLTNEQIRALYTPYTGAALTPEQETQNANIAKFLQDLAQFMGTAGVSQAATRASARGSTEAVTYAAEALTEVTGNRMADYLDTIAVYVREIVGLLRSRVSGNAVATAALSNATQSVASSSLAPTVNLASRNSITGLGVPLYQPQPIAPQGVGGSGDMGDTLTQWFTGRVLQKPTGPEQPPVINVTLPSIAVTVQITQAVPDAMTLARDIGDGAARQISRKLAPSLNAELARLAFGQRLRDGDPTKAG